MVSCNLVKRGMQWCSWLRHCAESRKVARSIPDGVTGIFRWHNPSGRTMALGLTQPLTEMSTRNISWGKKRPVSRTDKLTTFMCRLCWNLGASTSWNPQGLSRPVMGLFCFWSLVKNYLPLYRACINVWRQIAVASNIDGRLYKTCFLEFWDRS